MPGTTQFFTPPSSFTASSIPISAHGTTITYADGSQCLDGISGLWNVPLGYGHQGVADAVHQALLEASYLTCFRSTHRWAERASDALLKAAGPGRYGRTIHATSGSAALDSTMKVVRQIQILRDEPNRRVIVSLKGSYHGTTLGAMSLTGEDLGQKMYGIDTRMIRHVDHHRPRDLERLLDREGDRIAAVVLEPVQGSGTHVVGEQFLAAVFEGRRRHGYLIVADEVATGFGRTGPLFASQAWAEDPDILVTSKGLTNGTQAASAILLSHTVTQTLDETDSPFMHGETQAGSPASCAAILATLRAFEEEDILGHGRLVAAHLDARIRAVVERVPGARSTGTGCFRSIRLPGNSDIPGIVSRCRAHGAVVQPGPSSIQLVPALVYTPSALDHLMDRVEDTIASLKDSHGTVAA